MSRRRWSAVVLSAMCVLAFLLLLTCSMRTRDGEGWVRSAVSLGRIGDALHAYHDVNGRLPPAVVFGKNGRPLYSWRVLLLPYAELDPLSRQFRLDEPWDSEHNLPLSRATPRCYVPASGGRDGPGETRYQVLVGPGTAFERPGLSWDDFPDGLGNTLLVVEGGDPVIWSRPADVAYDPAGPLSRLGGVYDKPVHFLGREVGRRPGFVACFADGSSRFVRAVVTRNGGEPVDLGDLD